MSARVPGPACELRREPHPAKGCPFARQCRARGGSRAGQHACCHRDIRSGEERFATHSLSPRDSVEKAEISRPSAPWCRLAQPGSGEGSCGDTCTLHSLCPPRRTDSQMLALKPPRIYRCVEEEI
ncbi:hypothetical protein KIL84_019059 [Mauremys mutica]|uniref:Uncharacterized protein n=1 Tax=Mauremys mutica TaxID=74926 RepID=A0A9D3XW84_9SAUR|nr:hypothetical protein KIL84_019059 [Mauremys mutica]